jgi:hypothetical protein
MIIEGAVVHVRETWPLQLVVQSPQGRYDVTLMEETQVIRNDRHVSPGELKPRMKVEVSGEGQGSALTAQLIRIMD